MFKKGSRSPCSWPKTTGAWKDILFISINTHSSSFIICTGGLRPTVWIHHQKIQSHNLVSFILPWHSSSLINTVASRPCLWKELQLKLWLDRSLQHFSAIPRASFDISRQYPLWTRLPICQILSKQKTLLIRARTGTEGQKWQRWVYQVFIKGCYYLASTWPCFLYSNNSFYHSSSFVY